jgi:hypothetical protein
MGWILWYSLLPKRVSLIVTVSCGFCLSQLRDGLPMGRAAKKRGTDGYR